MLEEHPRHRPGGEPPVREAPVGSDGDLGFMQNDRGPVQRNGSKLIVDDISYGDEPYFQDGLISQGVDYVTSRGDDLLQLAAGNSAGPISGYLSAFRGVSTTVGYNMDARTPGQLPDLQRWDRLDEFPCCQVTFNS